MKKKTTSKKKGKKYKGGFTIDCTKYQQNPTQILQYFKDYQKQKKWKQ